MFSEFFAANIVGVYLVYGLSFLILSLVVTYKLRKLSRFELTEAFILLAMFGFMHGITEWVDAMEVSGVEFDPSFAWMKLALLSFSFAILLQFGLCVIISGFDIRPPRSYVSWAPLGAYVLFFLALFTFNIGPTAGAILARPLFGFTGAGLSAIAIVNLHRRMKEVGLPEPEPAMLWMGAGFATFAVFTGLITTYHFPLSAGVPTPVFRAGCALVIAWSGTRTIVYLHTLFRSSKVQFDQYGVSRGRSPDECRSGLIAFVETLRGLVGGSAITLFLLAVKDYNHRYEANVRADRSLAIEGVEDWDGLLLHTILYLREGIGPVICTLARRVENPALRDIVGEIDADAGILYAEGPAADSM